jgi:uncharacterized protein (TIGR03000 family)
VVAPPIISARVNVPYLPPILSANRGQPASATAATRVAAPPREPLTPPAGQATVVVLLPADAKLTANGRALATTSDRRIFATPDLEPGKSFQYTFTAEVVRGGKPLAMTKKVLVRAGEETQVQFDIPAAIAAR